MAGLLDTILGTTPDQQAAISGLLAGYQKGGGLLSGFVGANDAIRQAREDAQVKALRDLQMQQAQLGVQKGGMELDQMRMGLERQTKIRDELARLQSGQQPQRQPQAPSFSTPEIGGIPMFSQGTTVQPQAQPQPAQQGGYGQQLAGQFIQQAQVYQRNGDFEGANKLFEHAAKFMPEVHKIEVAMRQGKPVNVITYKDGTQQVSGFDVVPKVHWADTGGAITPVNEYTMTPMGSMGKTMTPGERDTSARGWATLNNTIAQQGKPVFNAEAGGFVYPPTANNPQGGIVRVPGLPEKPLTEDQAKASGWLIQASNAWKNMQSVAFDENGNLTSAVRPGFNDALATIPSMGATTAIANTLRSTNRQKFMQASSSLSEALLRAATGAGVTKQEADQKIAELTPVAGDSEATVKQKLDAIPLYIESLKARSGRGAGNIERILQNNGVTGSWDESDPLGLRK